jgi:phosphohistidine phosphatase
MSVALFNRAFRPFGVGCGDRLAHLIQSDAVLSVALVGHEPNLSTLLAYLVAGTEDAFVSELKKGAVACIGFEDEPRAGDAVLLWLAQPKLLRAAAGA